MFKMDEVTGEQIVRQGDDYSFSIVGISDDWDVYYSVYRASDRKIMFEIKSKPENEVTLFVVSPSLSNLLTVPVNKKAEIYYYGVKRCKDGREDTVIVGTKRDGSPKDVTDLNKVTVLPLTNEGDENGSSENS